MGGARFLSSRSTALEGAAQIAATKWDHGSVLPRATFCFREVINMPGMQPYQPTQDANSYVESVIRRHLKKTTGVSESASVRRLPRPVDTPAA